MRRFLFSLGFLVSFSGVALAKHHEAIYKGHGNWKNAAGESKDYSVLVSIKKLDDGSLRSNITLDCEQGQKTINHLHVDKGNGFFDVKNPEGVVIGSGYCHHVEDHHVTGGVHLCHEETAPAEGVKVEVTIHATLDEIRSIGSYTDANGTKAWKDHARRIYPAEENN